MTCPRHFIKCSGLESSGFSAQDLRKYLVLKRGANWHTAVAPHGPCCPRCAFHVSSAENSPYSSKYWWDETQSRSTFGETSRKLLEANPSHSRCLFWPGTHRRCYNWGMLGTWNHRLCQLLWVGSMFINSCVIAMTCWMLPRKYQNQKAFNRRSTNRTLSGIFQNSPAWLQHWIHQWTQTATLPWVEVNFKKNTVEGERLTIWEVSVAINDASWFVCIAVHFFLCVAFVYWSNSFNTNLNP